MAKRIKRIEKGVESIKKEIEDHLSNLEEDIKMNKIEQGRYHAKEIDKSLLNSLEIKLKFLGIDDPDLDYYKEKLRKLLNELARGD